MKRSRFVGLAAIVAAVVAAAVAAMSASPASAASATPVASEATALNVGFAVDRFVVRGKRLVAIGRTIATFTSPEGAYTVTKPFVSRPITKAKAQTVPARQMQAATRICDVLSLNLGPLHLELLGLIVDLSKVVLTIKADSNGGLLGSLLCGLAGGGGLGGILGTATNAAKLTNVAQTSGLSLGPGFSVPLATAGTGAIGTASVANAAQAVCTVLDLVLGPLDLNLLGLMVHLDQVHLTITADPTKGLLGSLLCGLAGGLPTTPVAAG